MSDPTSVSVDPGDGSCWVADTGMNRVVHLDAHGKELSSSTGFSWPVSVSVNSRDAGPVG